MRNGTSCLKRGKVSRIVSYSEVRLAVEERELEVSVGETWGLYPTPECSAPALLRDALYERVLC
jgi:hypothetical protein